MIREIANVTNASVFQQLADDIKKQTFLELKERQASLRQLERLTGIGKVLFTGFGVRDTDLSPCLCPLRVDLFLRFLRSLRDLNKSALSALSASPYKKSVSSVISVCP